MNWAVGFACMLLVLYLAYCARLFCLGFANIKRHCDSEAYSQAMLLSLLDFDRCDCESVLLCETQRPILELLETRTHGVSMRRMRCEFAYLSAEYPEIFDGSRFSNWLHALLSEGVIETTGRTVTISNKGRIVLEGLECRAHQPCDEFQPTFSA